MSDFDPMALPCEACGADAAEPCRFGCLGAVSDEDWADLANQHAVDEALDDLAFDLGVAG